MLKCIAALCVLLMASVAYADIYIGVYSPPAVFYTAPHPVYVQTYYGPPVYAQPVYPSYYPPVVYYRPVYYRPMYTPVYCPPPRYGDVYIRYKYR